MAKFDKASINIAEITSFFVNSCAIGSTSYKLIIEANEVQPSKICKKLFSLDEFAIFCFHHTDPLLA